MPDAVRRSVHLGLAEGLHVRPCSLIAKAASNGPKIVLRSGGKEAEAASMMDLMTLGLEQGSDVEIECEDPSGGEIVNRIAWLFENDFPAE